MGKWEKLKIANLENSVNVQKQPQKILYKKAWRNGVRSNYVSYLFVSFWYYYISILSRSSRTEMFLRKVSLKISQNAQENACTGVSFLITVNNFINEETPEQCFQKPFTIFTKRFVVDVRLGYKYASLLPPALKPSYEDFLLWKYETYYSSMVNIISEKNCYHVILPP